MSEFISRGLKISDLKIVSSDILNYLETGSDDSIPFFNSMIEEELQEIESLLVYFGYIIVEAALKDNKLLVGSEQLNIGVSMAHYFKGVRKLAVFVCSAGAEISNRPNYFHQKGEDLKAYISDVTASYITDKIAENLQCRLISELTNPEFKYTNFYNPGNCGWTLKDQVILFNLLPFENIGVTLNSSGMMMPIKSLSGIIGMGEEVVYHSSSCSICPSKNCLYRKVAYDS